MSRTIRLTESDLVNIVKNILSEQTTPAPATPRFKLPNGGTVTIKNTYGAGYYSMIHTDKAGNAFDNTKQIKPIITEATTFLKANKGSFIPKIIIRSGESIIPNSDVEGDGRALGRGQLSEKRRQKITAYITKEFQALVADGTISKVPVIVYFFEEAKTTEIPPLCTPTNFGPYIKWVRSTPEQKMLNPNNEKYAELQQNYNKDQKTEIQFSIIPDLGPNQCSFNVRIGVHYDDVSLQHKCNYAKYEISANGVVLKTINSTAGAGKPYADMNNGGGTADSQGNKDFGGKRMNYFKLNDKKLVEDILSKSPDGETIVIRAKCLSPGYNGGTGCHKDAPHVTVHDTDGNLTIDTYPKIDDGEVITMDKCGKKLISGGGTKTKSADSVKSGEDAGGKTTTPKLTGKKINFTAPKVGTLTAQQAIQNQVSSGNVQKQVDGTYLVIKSFNYNGIQYNAGDVIVKVI